ncbi:sugar-specific transcriptional regulator TrmB [Halohasta litchfieldiae]|jgi:sugar-specific transcriptional regulator TrmB|uniref:Sugar-specific transcriptional regulator TrmB n=1 Tax=Halohasta litchfieldiae TaxID=1073996 RepID=A0A1H6RSU5_9EURY|nr:TrmB family transcriptional regulator [Halohasta litchfieldiae]ATW89289.1 sugar-specific transcriptional regulator TrmB [Halohasta litchfieldiae]SEI58821.1 Sugar-specific transcriptional regulator TrmB [Halohasta litchfieldiae]
MADDLRQTLDAVGDRFNLGDYEIDAYLAVLEHGQLTASEIADRTDIPQPRVYDTVRSLSDRQLVELRESRPMQVVAIDPEDAFGEIQSSFTEMVDELTARYTAPTRETEAVSLVKSRSTIIRHLRECIESAEFELALSLTPELLTQFAEDLQRQIANGVSIDLLLTPATAAPDPETFDYLSVATTVRARRGITTPVLAVADGEHSVYATQDALRDDQDRYGVIFNRSALGFLISGFFGTVLWTTAETLAVNGTERPFPRRYASIRRAVKDIRELGGDFYATVEGRDIETGEPRICAGKIVDLAFQDSEEIAALTVDTESGPVEIGGLVAALEDVEGQEIHIGRESPPEI